MPPKSKPHKQVPAKITAYVDEGIKELVELLNTFDKVETIESCEGGKNNWATILLSYGPPDTKAQETADFAVQLVNRISKTKQYNWDKPPGGIYLSIQWWGIDADPTIKIKFPHERMKEVIKIFEEVRTGLPNDTRGRLQ